MVENPVIQRAIGYEAEIGFIRVRSADENKLTLSKGLRLWTGPGYQVTVDEQDGGRFDLEFITDPIDDLAPGGRDKVRATLSAVASEWENIEKEKGEFPATHFHAGPVPGAGITISYMTNIAQIQATAGLSLDAMHRIASGAAKHEWDEESANKNKGTDKGDKEEEGVGDYLGTAGQTDAWLWKPVEEATPALLRALGLKTDHWAKNYLTAIIALLVTPPIASWQTDAKAPYPKAFAGPLLARTDFATIIALLPNDLRVAIQSNREAWIRHLVGLVESVLAKVNDDSPPTIGDVGRSVFNPKSFSGKPPNFGDRLKLVDWYGDLTTGTDRLTADDYRERYADETGAAHLESLGSFGKKMDASSYRIGRLALLQAVVGAGVAVAGAIGATVEPDAKAGWTALAIGSAMALHGSSKTIAAVRDRPIFEFRTLSNMVVRETLVAAGLELWDFVDLAHGRPQARMSGGEKLWNWVGSKLSRN